MRSLVFLKRIIIVIAIALLFGAWLYSASNEKNMNVNLDNASQYNEDLKKTYSQAAAFREISTDPLIFSAMDSSGKDIGYVALAEANGYSGPLRVSVAIDLSGKTINTVILENKETPSYLQEVIGQGYLDNFQGAKVDSPFALGIDIDGISGATITSNAIAKAVREATHAVGRDVLRLDIQELGEPWVIGVAEILVILLFTCAIIFSLIYKQPKLRVPLICISIFILGFWLNRPISLPYLTSALLGFLPPLRENLLWHLILFTGICLPILFGKNIYCYWLCPFGGLQEAINKLCGVKYRLKIAKGFRITRYFLLWLGLFLVITSKNPAMANFEPFSTVFGFLGTKLDWLEAIAVLVIGVISYRFWCAFLCPVGAALDLLKTIRNKIVDGIFQLKS